MVFGCESYVFITIIGGYFRCIRDHEQLQSVDEQEAAVLMLRRFQHYVVQFIAKPISA